MSEKTMIERLRADARQALELHERSRSLLVAAVRAGVSAGLSQRDIAAAIGRSQPEVSRLLRFHGTSELGRRLSANRKKIIDITAAQGLRNVRVFGSVARGTDTAASDVDLLVDIPDGIGLFALSRLENDIAQIIGADVDLIPARSLRNNLAGQVLREAIPL
ncbi:nucleotidyltransferase domain-containing protein [Subtercola sp. PAMC28395]|uniref:nucleotidyltransferase family protein n=1 Tax=Subtercola sp. PAMC28395 TaxID=2846775 RepID=UPI001C0C888A|nr:nucleotidyltransferase domain-containing protein [Subtercola sp. PAMC28395]QWT24761.1 nucleotidyltransferase domain-containing protein [Subtercola sp. PAMC28395]